MERGRRAMDMGYYRLRKRWARGMDKGQWRHRRVERMGYGKWIRGNGSKGDGNRHGKGIRNSGSKVDGNGNWKQGRKGHANMGTRRMKWRMDSG